MKKEDILKLINQRLKILHKEFLKLDDEHSLDKIDNLARQAELRFLIEKIGE